MSVVQHMPHIPIVGVTETILIVQYSQEKKNVHTILQKKVMSMLLAIYYSNHVNNGNG